MLSLALYLRLPRRLFWRSFVSHKETTVTKKQRIWCAVVLIFIVVPFVIFASLGEIIQNSKFKIPFSSLQSIGKRENSDREEKIRRILK